MFAAPAFAQYEDPYEEQSGGEDGEVFDNRKLDEAQRRERAEERREKYGGDSPFAGDGAPDKIEKREERFSPGMQGGYRAGWGIPGGTLERTRGPGGIERDVDFSEGLTGQLFLWGDGGYQFIPELMVGIYLSGGYVFTDCRDDFSCTAWDFRGGIQGQWRFLPFGDVTPWVGLGAGWELFLLSASSNDIEQSWTYHGPELFMLQGGVDVWAPVARGHAGLFVAYSMGRFISRSVVINDQDDDVEGAAANHSWLFIGARGTF